MSSVPRMNNEWRLKLNNSYCVVAWNQEIIFWEKIIVIHQSVKYSGKSLMVQSLNLISLVLVGLYHFPLLRSTDQW